mgnify:CR=1 FL=1
MLLKKKVGKLEFMEMEMPQSIESWMLIKLFRINILIRKILDIEFNIAQSQTTNNYKE